MIIEGLINVIFGVLINIFDFINIPDTPQFILNFETMFLNLISFVMPLVNVFFNHTLITTILTFIYALLLVYINYKIIKYIIDFVKGWL